MPLLEHTDTGIARVNRKDQPVIDFLNEQSMVLFLRTYRFLERWIPSLRLKDEVI
jgi:hypothetical protein